VSWMREDLRGCRTAPLTRARDGSETTSASHSCTLAAIHSSHVTPSRDLPQAHNQVLALPSILIAMAHTRAQTATQRALLSPASNYQGICSSRRRRTSPADACRKSTPGHPAAQRQFSKARSQARRTQSPASYHSLSTSTPSMLFII